MWQQVDATNLGQVQLAFDVLQAHDDTWGSASELQQWMQARDLRMFYYPGTGYELVVAFEHYVTSGQWRLRTGGARGNLLQESGVKMAAKVVEFMRGEGLRELGMLSLVRSPTDPNQALLDLGLVLLRQNPEVAEVRVQAVPAGRRYEIVLT